MQTRGNSAANHLPVDSFVRRLASLCDLHRAPHGSPSELAGFVEALDANKHLAMDFWALIARMTDEESGKLSVPALNGRILEVIVTVVTGQSVAEMIARGGDDKRYVGEIASMLAGEDIHSPAADRNIAIVPSIPSDGEVASGRDAFESQFGRTHSSSSNRPAMSAPIVVTKPFAAAMRQDGVSLKPSGVMAEAVEAQALTAGAEGSSPDVIQETDAVQPSPVAVGKPADSIRRREQRPAVQPISARVKEVASDSNSADIPVEGADGSKAALARDTVSRLREPSTAQGVLFPEDKEYARISMESHGERESRSVLLPMLLVLVLAGGGWGAYLLQRAGVLNIFGNSADTNQTITPESDSGTSGPVRGSGENRGARDGSTVAQSESPERSDDGLSVGSPAGTSAAPSTTEPQSSSSSNEPVEGQPAIDPGLYTSTVISKKTRKGAEEVAPTAAGSGMVSSGLPSGVTEPGNGRPLVVWKASPPEPAPIVRAPPPPPEPKHGSNGLIEGAKMSGADPVYPKIAKENRISGTVILHATITRTGSVTNLTVVSGPVDLRKSAKAAVSKWRYRPYLLDGQPTEAERTIRVDFKPDR